jgi:predicted SAM-dependent methyltransferase
MIKRMAKRLLGDDSRRRLRSYEKRLRYAWRRQEIRLPLLLGQPLRIIVGAALTHQKGWYSTNEQWLDIASEQCWTDVFKGKALLTHVVAEHVFEHLTEPQARSALALIHRHMLPGALIRIAVPDGYHPDPGYLAQVGIAGKGPDAEDHKQLLNADSLRRLLEDAGFTARQLEGYRADGHLLLSEFDGRDGFIQRSRGNPENMRGVAGWDFVDANTSLIMDGVKAR